MTSDLSEPEPSDVPCYGTGMVRDSANQSPRGESGLTGLAEQRLNALALKRGWLKGQRWATEATEEEIEKLDRPLTAKEVALLSAIQGAKSNDPRVRMAAVGNLCKMEAMNQRDDAEPAITPGNVGVVVNNSGSNRPLPREWAAALIMTEEGRALIQREDAANASA